jgi:hypothetical protein
MMWHRTDPAPARTAAPKLARMATEGRMTLRAAHQVLLDMDPEAGNPAGFAARAAWALHDTVMALARERRRTVWAIRGALEPLLAGRACRQTLFDAAERADPGLVLTAGERRRLIEAEAARALRLRPRR